MWFTYHALHCLSKDGLETPPPLRSPSTILNLTLFWRAQKYMGPSLVSAWPYVSVAVVAVGSNPTGPDKMAWSRPDQNRSKLPRQRVSGATLQLPGV